MSIIYNIHAHNSMHISNPLTRSHLTTSQDRHLHRPCFPSGVTEGGGFGGWFFVQLNIKELKMFQLS